MIPPELANMQVRLDKSRAMVEVLDIPKENDIRIQQNGISTKLLKKGLYDFETTQSAFFEGPGWYGSGAGTSLKRFGPCEPRTGLRENTRSGS